jgi:hypothetical protein
MPPSLRRTLVERVFDFIRADPIGARRIEQKNRQRELQKQESTSITIFRGCFMKNMQVSMMTLIQLTSKLERAESDRAVRLHFALAERILNSAGREPGEANPQNGEEHSAMLQWRTDTDYRELAAKRTDGAALLGAGALAVLMLLTAAVSEQGETISPAASNPEAVAAAMAPGGSDPAARAIGADTRLPAAEASTGPAAVCKEVFGALGEASVSGSASQTLTTWSDVETARPALSSISRMVVTALDMQAKAVSIVFASPNGSGCAGDFVRVVPIPLDCATVSLGLPKESKRAPAYQGVDLVTIPSGWNVALVPAPNDTCVVVTSALFASNPP